MIGMIVTGHGNFAGGITSALELIAGKQENYESVEFESLDNTDVLEKKLKEAGERLSACDGIIVFTDLVGGSPFKTAVTIWVNDPKVRILSGTNLGEILETAMGRNMENDLDKLADHALETGKAQLVKFEMPADNEEEAPSDGI